MQLCSTNATFGPCDCRPEEANHPPVVGVLDFPDPSPSVQTHVNHGTFWSTGANLGRRFHWDAWLAPRTSGTLVSDGYGESHALRWGAVLQDGQFVFQGEFRTNNGSVKFSAAEGPAPGEWGHHAIDLIEDSGLPPSALVYWNGICVGFTSFAAVDRQAGVTGNGDGTLYVMGSPSGGLGGRLAAVRAFETFSPYSGGYPLLAFLPERTFSPWIGSISADFLAEYTRPGTDIQDLSSGYAGGDAVAPLQRHPGTLESSIPASGVTVLPHWVADPESPYGTVGQLPVNTHEVIPVPAPPPAGALVFDSFGRRGQNFVWQQVPTLGQTEAGSLGPQPWTIGITGPPDMPAAFGIINGRAVYLEHGAGVAWVDVHSADQDIRIDRFHAGWGQGTTGIAFHVIDARNWGYLFADEMTGLTSSSPSLIYLGLIVDGVQKGNAAILTPPTENWTRLRLVARATTATAYIDDGRGGWTTIGMLQGLSAATNATGAGLAGGSWLSLRLLAVAWGQFYRLLTGWLLGYTITRPLRGLVTGAHVVRSRIEANLDGTRY